MTSSVPVPRPSEPLPTVSQHERANAFAEILHELIRPDNGKCNQCGAEWFYRLDGSWEYIDGEHFPHCIARRVIERRTGEIRLSAFVAELHANAPPASSEEAANSDTPQKLHGVVWALIGDSDGRVVLERCEKKARVLGVGEWFLPGGKIEGDETPEECLRREIGEEWPGVELLTARPLPIVEGSSVPPGPRGLFLMRPFVITVRGEVPSHSSEGTPLRWASVAEALFSPVPQVRMIVAAARVQGENSQ